MPRCSVPPACPSNIGGPKPLYISLYHLASHIQLLVIRWEPGILNPTSIVLCSTAYFLEIFSLVHNLIYLFIQSFIYIHIQPASVSLVCRFPLSILHIVTFYRSSRQTASWDPASQDLPTCLLKYLLPDCNNKLQAMKTR